MVPPKGVEAMTRPGPQKPWKRAMSSERHGEMQRLPERLKILWAEVNPPSSSLHVPANSPVPAGPECLRTPRYGMYGERLDRAVAPPNPPVGSQPWRKRRQRPATRAQDCVLRCRASRPRLSESLDSADSDFLSGQLYAEWGVPGRKLVYGCHHGVPCRRRYPDIPGVRGVGWDADSILGTPWHGRNKSSHISHPFLEGPLSFRSAGG
ncbi:hypothetical protein VTK73DRAFT_8798 [Phialemonium thermophilum]|uniref:Uncharacterized protein n=1 Tax=Phialemonium thermophilum TaxID=223376 RepID=A0ABR3W6E8_9PEZI